MATKKKDQVVPVDVDPAELAQMDWGEHQGGGFRDDTPDDYAIPFLTLAQKNTPQADEDDEKYIKGLKPGQFFDSVTDEIYGDELLFIPCYKTTAMVEWVPRAKGGGYVGQHPMRGEVHQSATQDPEKRSLMNLPNGNDLMQTTYMWGLIVDSKDDTNPREALIAFKSTSLKIVRALNTKIRKIKGGPPMYAFVLKLGSVSETNAHGTFKNFEFSFINGSAAASIMRPDSELFQKAFAFHKMASAGESKADFSKQDGGAAEATGDSPI